MALKGKRKAAMLLASLDAATATELLKGQPQEIVQEIAMELSQLDAIGQVEPEEATRVAKEFCAALHKVSTGNIHVKSFINSLLKSTGREKAAEIHAQMQEAIRDKDPFIAITSATPGQIAAALEGEPAQAIALVLSSLPPKLGTEVLARLHEDISPKALWKMTKAGEVSPRTVRRVGEMVCKRLMELTSDEEGGVTFEETLPKETLRKVALILSGLTKERRDVLLGDIEENNEDTANMVRALMVTWEDIPKIENRSLQEVLRTIDAGVLAKALFGADMVITEKVRSNISERAAEMVDEETSLMAEPRKKEILEAREAVAKPLRDANEAEKLAFIEEE
jgi:flagellar motor switch protein FliG